MMLKDQLILTFDKANARGVVYPISLAEDIIDQIKKRPDGKVLGINGTGMISRLQDVSHILTNPRLEGNKLIVDIQIIKTETGNILKKAIKDTSISFRMAGEEKVFKGNISVFSISCSNALPTRSTE